MFYLDPRPKLAKKGSTCSSSIASKMPDYIPLEVPPCKLSEKPGNLAEEQTQKRDEVLTHFSKEGYQIPGVENGELLDEEKMWLSDECFQRYVQNRISEREKIKILHAGIFALLNGSWLLQLRG